MKALNDKHAFSVRADAAYTTGYVATTEVSTKDCDRVVWHIDHDDDTGSGTAGAVTLKIQAKNPKIPKATATWSDCMFLNASAVAVQEYTITPGADLLLAFPPGGIPVQGPAMRLVVKAAAAKGSLEVWAYKTRNTGGIG